MTPPVPLVKNCVRNFVESLDERQDIRKIMRNEADGAKLCFNKSTFDSWLKADRSLDDVCLFVAHQLLHVYSYAETTLIGRGDKTQAHAMRHFPTNQQQTILNAFISSTQEFIPQVCEHAHQDLFDVFYKFRDERNQRYETYSQPGLHITVILDEESLTFDLRYVPTQVITKGHLSLSQLLVTAEFLFSQISDNPDVLIGHLEFISSSPKAEDSLVTKVIEKEENLATMANIFESVAQRMPSKTGLVFGATRYSYSEINARANQIAAWIKSLAEIEPNTMIALCLDRSELIIFGILAVWKLCAAYVPIDPTYPPARIDIILNECEAKLILTDSSSRSKLPQVTCPVLDISVSMATKVPSHEHRVKVSETVQNRRANDLGLVIYTSGTTGRPKGVMISQKSLVNQCADYRFRYSDLCADEVVVQLFNYAFNAFLEPLTLSICEGLTLVMVPFKLLMDPKSLLDYLEVNGVTHIDGTPSLASQFNLSRLQKLKRVAVGGEPLTHAHRSTFLKNNPTMRLYNIYGNSEGTLCTLTSDVTNSASFIFTREVRNKRVLLLSHNLKPVPVGAVGELCLTGAGVSIGYWRNEALTNEKFIQNPFENTEPFSRLYRTGDLGMMEFGGGIQIIGRKDLQVKVRGIRIEISEIEATMNKMMDIEKSAVIWREANVGNQLLGFFVPSRGKLETEKVREFLTLNLPEYMIPSIIFSLDKFPLTSNGKICRAQLLDLIPAADYPDNRPTDEAQANILNESAICSLWEEVLSLPVNSVEKSNNFFSLGGNSLLVIRLMNLIYERFGIQLNPTKIIENGGSFGSFLNQDEEAVEVTQIQIPKLAGNDLPLSIIQERILSSSKNYTNHFVLEFKFLRGVSDPETLLNRISDVVQRHEILRTIYPRTKFGINVQRILNQIELKVDKIQKSTDSVYSYVQLTFDLSTQLPLRIALLDCDGNFIGVLIIVHSIALDNLAYAQLIQELTQEFKPRSEVTLNYSDYAQYQKTYIAGHEIKDLLNFWKERLNLPPSNVPMQTLRMKEFETKEIDLTTTEFQCLRAVAQAHQVSLYDLFLTVQVLSQREIEPDESEHTVGTYLSLRDHPQLYGVMGNLTQVVPLTFDLEDTQGFEKTLQKVVEYVKEAKAKQRFPVDLTSGALGGVHNLVKSDLFRFMFDLKVTSPKHEFDLEGSVYKLHKAESGLGFLLMTHVFTSIEICEGSVRIVFGGWDLVKEMKNQFREILVKMIEI